MMLSTDNIVLKPPSLPTGGGAVTGLKAELSSAGPDGAATLSFPLPITSGRGYSPALSLLYHSYAGNGAFGIGWSLDLPAVSRRTRQGAPSYGDSDEYIGPDGEVIVPELSSDGQKVQRNTDTLLGDKLAVMYTVTSWRSRQETSFSRLEFWLPQASDGENSAGFWVLYSPDGEVSLLGRNRQARIDSGEAAKVAVWLAESSVSASGEQIYYQYRCEDEQGCSADEISSHPGSTLQRYLVAAYYGNVLAGRKLPALNTLPDASDWLFILTLDYGERSQAITDRPVWQTPGSGEWLCREDCFSGYEYGFDLRTRRLCRQILMFHRLSVLSGNEAARDKTPDLIFRVSLEYAETPVITTLKTIYQAAYEEDGALRSLPPLVLGWQDAPLTPTPEWQKRDDMANMNLQQPYQMVDLNGEGLVGILYQDNGAWWYRAPVRLAGDSPDATTWDEAVPLSSVPTLRENGVLADMNGDGYLEWFVVTTPGVAGHYDRTPSREWRHFTPVSSLPVEYFHPAVQLADITGSGLVDMVLIGPKSLRLYGGTGEGWVKAQTVLQNAGITLPVPGTDARVLVAFSDMAGSGQQHLVEVRAGGVRYWPNMGHGQFGPPISMPGFSQAAETFDPARLYLADIDGSGNTDLIYAFADHLLVYLNQSGNRFASPVSVNFPAGVLYDRTCRLQLADIQGLGVASLILTVPHPKPQHWVCQFSGLKPWLLASVNNNMGASHSLFYRSSAQFWLDEKAQAAAAGKAIPSCYLPFAMQTLQRTEILDEITGNRLVSTIRYRHGVWDGRERELRGFAGVEVNDTDIHTSHGTADEISMPAISRSWYATGMPEVDEFLKEEYWQGDDAAYPAFTPRFTQGNGEDEQAIIPDENISFWLHRGMRGMLLRSELYGADDSAQATVPYTVTEVRPQVRLVEATGNHPVVWSSVAESRTYNYERVSSDPQCHQQIQLVSDQTGQPLYQVNVSYPRRSQPAASPWSDTLPETLFASSFDAQQNTLFLETQRINWHTMSDIAAGIWVLGLMNSIRSDTFSHPSASVPSTGLTLELLRQNDGLLADTASATFTGQQQVWFLNTQDEATTETPAFPPRAAFTETAVLDESTLSSLTDDLTEENLMQAGYFLSDYLFTRAGEEGKTLWTARNGYTTYASAEHFWLPATWRGSLLTDMVAAVRDNCDCVVTQINETAGFSITAEYDWRFLMPVRITDANDNIQVATLDALGRVTSVRFYGTENGEAAGYSEAAVSLPATADAALSLSAPLPLSQCLVYVADSWMPEVAEKLPPHVVTLLTDRYDSDPDQQICQQVTFSDGLGRVLQTSTRQTAGSALQRESDGSLLTDTSGMPVVTDTDFRWAVSGRTEYDNKGQPVRTWQPYFLNDWKYVSNDTARIDLYADRLFYDPPGRLWQTETAKGWLRRTFFTPWFVVSEDENDTSNDTAGSG